MSIWRWAEWITPVPEQHRVTLGEGNTPLVRSRSIGPSIGLDNLWLKLEAGNPASSYIYSVPGMTGVETISFELAEQAEQQFNRPIDHVFCPSGGGGLCVAVCRGFGRLVSEGRLTSSPAIECVQPEGNDTMASALSSTDGIARPIDCTTRISGLQVPNINDGHLVVQELRPTGGRGHLVTDEAVWNVQRRLASEEGIFSEPAGATALAGCLEAVAGQHVDRNATVVCLVTGSGFKDEASIDLMLEGTDCQTLELDEL